MFSCMSFEPSQPGPVLAQPQPWSVTTHRFCCMYGTSGDGLSFVPTRAPIHAGEFPIQRGAYWSAAAAPRIRPLGVGVVVRIT